MTIDLGKIFRSILGINWRTNAGSILPIVTALPLVVKAISTSTWPDREDEAVISLAISGAWTALMAKDKNVTGGTVSNVDGTVAKPVSLIEGGKVV